MVSSRARATRAAAEWDAPRRIYCRDAICPHLVGVAVGDLLLLHRSFRVLASRSRMSRSRPLQCASWIMCVGVF